MNPAYLAYFIADYALRGAQEAAASQGLAGMELAEAVRDASQALDDAYRAWLRG
jgi:hypothetical protein